MIRFAVATLDHPAAEPFAVVRIDTNQRIGDGCAATVVSLHWSQYVAEQIADGLNRNPDATEPTPKD